MISSQPGIHVSKLPKPQITRTIWLFFHTQLFQGSQEPYDPTWIVQTVPSFEMAFYIAIAGLGVFQISQMGVLGYWVPTA